MKVRILILGENLDETTALAYRMRCDLDRRACEIAAGPIHGIDSEPTGTLYRNGYDVVLLAPDAAHRIREVRRGFRGCDVPIGVINRQLFDEMRSETICIQAIGLMPSPAREGRREIREDGAS